MTIGDYRFVGDRLYLITNRNGTLVKLHKINIIGRFYLEILQGLGRKIPLQKIRKIAEKYKKER